MINNALLTPSSTIINASLDLSFAAIDWQAPWLNHLNQLKYLAQTVETLSKQAAHATALDTEDSADNNADDSSGYNTGYSTTAIADLLNTAMRQQADTVQTSLPQTKAMPSGDTHTLKFVAQDALPEGEAYESFIATTGNIPTRDNLHDLFNGSIWLTFPKTKALLNYQHMIEIAKQGIGASRGRVRDTITVFDENGAILVTSEPSIGEALIDFNWQASLVDPRHEWDNPKLPNKNATTAVYIFGHALLEQLIQPRKTLCAHSVVLNVSADFFEQALPERMRYVDNKLATHMHHLLSQDEVTPRQLAPLPILGVPHFWAENTDSSFYEDTQVFRSGRRRKS